MDYLELSCKLRFKLVLILFRVFIFIFTLYLEFWFEQEILLDCEVIYLYVIFSRIFLDDTLLIERTREGIVYKLKRSISRMKTEYMQYNFS